MTPNGLNLVPILPEVNNSRLLGVPSGSELQVLCLKVGFHQ